MYNIKKIIPIIVLLCSFNLCAQSHREAVCSFLDVINFDDTILKIEELTLKQQMKVIPSLEQYEGVMKEYLSICLHEGNYFKNKTIDAYQDIYTIEELEELTQMIESNSTLKKYMTMSIEITQKLSGITQKRIAEKQDILLTMIKAKMEELSENEYSSDPEF